MGAASKRIAIHELQDSPHLNFSILWHCFSRLNKVDAKISLFNQPHRGKSQKRESTIWEKNNQDGKRGKWKLYRWKSNFWENNQSTFRISWRMTP